MVQLDEGLGQMSRGSTIEQNSWAGCSDANVQERQELRAAFASAAPFPHLVIDGLFSESFLRPVVDDFENAAPDTWRDIQSGLQKKRATLPDVSLPPSVQQYFNTLNSGPFIRFLGDITGIPNLIPDPALHGGGMHEVGEGGGFEIHVDFDQHPRTFLNNRLVVITYLNDDWSATDGGNLELWHMKPARCAVSVTPIFGRTVILAQSPMAAHGHPHPIREGRKRRSVTAYFYTNGHAPATTSNLLPTTYVAHSGYSLSKRLELALRLVVPPIIPMTLRSIKAKAQHALPRAHAQ